MGITTTVKVEVIGVSFEENETNMVRFLDWKDWDKLVSSLTVLQMFSKLSSAVLTVDGFKISMIDDTKWGFEILNSTDGDVIEGRAWEEMIDFVQDAREFATRMGVSIVADVSSFGSDCCKVSDCDGVVVNSDDYIGSDPGYCLSHAWQCRQFECIGRVNDRGAECRNAQHSYKCCKCGRTSIYASIPCFSCSEEEHCDCDVCVELD